MKNKSTARFGSTTTQWFNNINIIDNAEVVAIYDTNENSTNHAKSLINDTVKIYKNIDDLINNNIADAYIIATPNFTHLEILKDIIKTNAHLLIEKPLCTTIEECKEFKNLRV